MKTLYSLFVISFLLTACNNNQTGTSGKTIVVENIKTIYATAVQDSFSISVSLPEGYDTSHKKYPVLFLLDANLYFDVMAVTIKKYAVVGLAPEAIVVGIGYKDFYAMDSLRSRDYTYPVAIPEYEMTHSGGAQRFLSFINEQLVPYIDSSYRSDSTQRILAGHSLGGYFACYALQEKLKQPQHKLNKFIAASPSLHYNHYYLLKQQEADAAKSNPINHSTAAYIAYGGMEDNVDLTDSSSIRLPVVMKRLDQSLNKNDTATSKKFTTAIFSNLDHMETQIPIFLKGLNHLVAVE